MISDFTLTKTNITLAIIFIDKITCYKVELSDKNDKMILTIFCSGTPEVINYMTFNKIDTQNLLDYSNAIINQINQ